MGARLRAFEWATTPLGPADGWPHALRTAVAMMLRSHQPVYIAWGPEQTSLYNDGYIPILGTRHPGALGKPYREVWPEIWDEFRPIVDATMAGEAQFFVDQPLPSPGRQDRPTNWFTFSWTPIPDETGAIGGFYCAATETTEQVLAQQDLERRVTTRTEELHRRAQQLSRLSSELMLAEQRERRRLARILHDHLQQVLAAANVTLAARVQRLPASETDGFDQVGSLIEEALRASRELSAELSPPVLHEIGLSAGLRWLAGRMKSLYGLQVELTIEEEADPGREDLRILIFESVRELLFNVVKHSGVHEASLRLARSGESRLQIVVEDHGKGLDVAALHAADDSDHGWGLFSIDERLSLLGGRLECESSPGAGARFTVLAPLGPGARTEAPLVAGETSLGAAEPEAADRAHLTERERVIRVLLVDDNALLRDGLAALIDVAPGMVMVGEASSGEEGVRKAVSLNPDVVLMDYSLPDLRGTEATRRICERMPRARVIGLSVHEDPDLAAEMLKAGAAAYISKTEPSAYLVDRIREVYARGRGPTQPLAQSP